MIEGKLNLTPVAFVLNSVCECWPARVCVCVGVSELVCVGERARERVIMKLFKQQSCKNCCSFGATIVRLELDSVIEK